MGLGVRALERYRHRDPLTGLGRVRGRRYSAGPNRSRRCSHLNTACLRGDQRTGDIAVRATVWVHVDDLFGAKETRRIGDLLYSLRHYHVERDLLDLLAAVIDRREQVQFGAVGQRHNRVSRTAADRAWAMCGTTRPASSTAATKDAPSRKGREWHATTESIILYVAFPLELRSTMCLQMTSQE